MIYFFFKQASGFFLPFPFLNIAEQLNPLKTFSNLYSGLYGSYGLEGIKPPVGYDSSVICSSGLPVYGNGLGPLVTDTAALGLALEAKNLGLANQAAIISLTDNVALTTSKEDAVPTTSLADLTAPADKYPFDKLLCYC